MVEETLRQNNQTASLLIRWCGGATRLARTYAFHHLPVFSILELENTIFNQSCVFYTELLHAIYLAMLAVIPKKDPDSIFIRVG